MEFFFSFPGFRTRESVVSAVPRRGDDVRSRADHYVQTTRTDGDREQSRGFRRKFVSPHTHIHPRVLKQY